MAAAIEAKKWEWYNLVSPIVSGQLAEMQDEDVTKALSNEGGGNKQRQELFQRMMARWTPVFMTEAYNIERKVSGQSRVEGLTPRAANAIMQAVEDRLLTNREWLGLQPFWKSVYLTAENGLFSLQPPG